MGSSEKVYVVNAYVSSRFPRCWVASVIFVLLLHEHLVDVEIWALTIGYAHIHRNILSAVAGITADANSLVSYARNAAQVRCQTRQVLRRMAHHSFDDLIVTFGFLQRGDASRTTCQEGLRSQAGLHSVRRSVFPLHGPGLLWCRFLTELCPKQDCDPSVFHFFSLVTILTTPSSFTLPIRRVITRGGKRPASERTMRLRRVYYERTLERKWG